MKKIFILFLLMISFSSFSQNFKCINYNQLKSYDTIYVDFNQDKYNETLLCGFILTSSGCFLATYSSILYVNRINSTDNIFDKEVIQTKFKNNLTLSCGFICVGLIFDIIGLNQDKTKIKYKDGKIILSL